MNQKEIVESINKYCGMPTDIGFAVSKQKSQAYKAGFKRASKELFDKFDKYACIKNDKWYLEFKKEFNQ